MLYFEDLEVGSSRSFGRYEVTRDEVLTFARQYDAQPFHLSDEGAAQTHFGRLAASGWHTCSMTMAMIVAHMAVEPRAEIGALGVEDIRWPRPVHPCDVLTCEMAIEEKRLSASRPGFGILRSRVTTSNQNGDPVLIMRPATLVKTRPAD